MDEIMDEESVARDFKSSYSPPPEPTWDDWATSIEIKLSTQGKVIVGLGAVVLGGLVLTVMQGKVVISLVKQQRDIIGVINGIVNGGNPNLPSEPVRVDYTEPQGRVDESKADPINEEELNELKARMEASLPKTNGEELQ